MSRRFFQFFFSIKILGSNRKYVNMTGNKSTSIQFFFSEMIRVCAAVVTLIFQLVPMINIGERAGQCWGGHF